MAGNPPQLVAINHDPYHAEHVGRTADGRQFFLTTPFEPIAGPCSPDVAEFVALYLFDPAGRLLEARIDSLGPQATMDDEEQQRIYGQRLAELGDVTFGRIEVAPFAVERFGTTFGLVPREPEHEDDHWAVVVQPGEYVTFSEPWDNGEYDT